MNYVCNLQRKNAYGGLRQAIGYLVLWEENHVENRSLLLILTFFKVIKLYWIETTSRESPSTTQFNKVPTK